VHLLLEETPRIFLSVEHNKPQRGEKENNPAGSFCLSESLPIRLVFADPPVWKLFHFGILSDHFRSTNIAGGAICLDERLPLDLIV